MPVTAKLSRKFYEKFGDEIANELVNWFNQVDATYRADLKELNELNFQRFDAKLQQRLAAQDAKWAAQFTRLEAKLEQRLGELDAKWRIEWERLDAKLEQRLGQLEAKLEYGLATVRTELRAELNTALARQKAELTRLMFRFWIATLVPLAGLIIGLHAGLR